MRQALIAAHLKTVISDEFIDSNGRVAPGVVTPLPPRGVAVKKPVTQS